MTTPNNQSLTDNQNKKIIDSLRYEIASLKSQITKKDDRISTLDAMLNQIMESHSARVRDYEDIEDKLREVIAMLRRRVPHGDILDFLKVQDSNLFQFKKLW
jgi:predicted RNase H-like nuclease (RuvC/YqgF family)